MYLDGTNVIQITRDLTDLVGTRLLWGYAGTAATLFVGLGVYFGMGISPLWSFVICPLPLLPWAIACSRLSSHTRKLRAETEDRGPGWARS